MSGTGVLASGNQNTAPKCFLFADLLSVTHEQQKTWKSDSLEATCFCFFFNNCMNSTKSAKAFITIGITFIVSAASVSPCRAKVLHWQNGKKSSPVELPVTASSPSPDGRVY